MASEGSSVLATAPPLDELVRRTATAFRRRFGGPPRWIAAAPGRVNLIGEHVDYNDGYVLPMAIERYVVAAGGPNEAARWRLHSATLEESAEGDLDSPPPQGHWTSYVLGTLAECRAEGVAPGPMDIALDATVPVGGGLSSSAALEVATATLAEAAARKRLDPIRKALLCQRAEHKYAGVPCGIMDQFSSVLGQPDRLMLLDCRSQRVQLAPLRDPQVTVLIINTNVRRELADGEYAKRRAQCEEAARLLGVASLRDVTLEQLESQRDRLGDALYRRARHVVSEIARTPLAAKALAASDWERVGRLMYASHASLRDDYEVSCPELDLLVELARQLGPEHGVIGCRMTGGGFGGCVVSLVRAGAVAGAARRLHDQYRERTGIEPTGFVTRPARGAHVVSGG